MPRLPDSKIHTLTIPPPHVLTPEEEQDYHYLRDLSPLVFHGVDHLVPRKPLPAKQLKTAPKSPEQKRVLAAAYRETHREEIRARTKAWRAARKAK